MVQEIFTYWLVAQVLGLAALPLARVWLHALPDEGYAFAKSLGLLLAGYLAWLAAMLGLASFGRPLATLCLLGVAATGAVALRAHVNHTAKAAGRRARDEGQEAADPAVLRFQAATAPVPQLPAHGWLAWARARWRLLLAYEAIFAAALVFLALLRSHEFGFVGPHPWGTERPMDYAFFNAIRQSERFPPHDPWLAGYSINYYYFGYLLMATAAELAGVSPPVGYNLSLALIFALAALGIAGVVYNLVGLTVRGGLDKETRRQGDKEHLGAGEDDENTQAPSLAELDNATANAQRSTLNAQRSVIGRWLVMLLAILLVLFSANQGGALQVLTGSDMAVALSPPELGRAVANGLGPRQPLPLDGPFRGEYFEGMTEIRPADQIEGFNWWNSSRAVWDTFVRCDDETGVCEPPSKSYAITEFPFFSFWLGDMHPHVMALPFGLLALALALNTFARPHLPAFGKTRGGWLDLVLTGVALGSLYVINSWDLPTYVLLFLAALAIRTQRDGPIRWRAYALPAGLALGAAFALFLPFHLTFRSLVGGKEPLVDLPILASITRVIGLVTWQRASLHHFLIIFGLFLLPLTAFVFTRGQPNRETLFWAGVSAAALVIGPLIGFPLLFLLPLGLFALVQALDDAAQPATSFALAAFALGCAIGFGAEIVYIRDVFEGLNPRLNTVFKFYYQIWLIWGIVAAYAVWALAANLRAEGSGQKPEWWRNAVAALCLLPAALLLVGSLVYPWLTAGKAFDEGKQVGLAGTTPRERTPEGVAAITWLRANAPGDAVVLEAVGPAYDTASLGFGGVSSATGLATVIGWEGHQNQWRGGMPDVLAQVGPRAADVATIYSTPDAAEARRLLEQYGVDFVYVGEAEQATYPPEGLAKLGQLGAPVFQQGSVTIYRVGTS
jgi:YYY domain-containing protein